MDKFFAIERLIHSTKTMIACLLGFALTKIISLPTDQWIVVTIVVVMCAQIYVGSVLNRAFLRFLGTLVGCLFAAGIIEFFGANDLVAGATIAVAGFCFSYIASIREDLSYAATLGAVTTAIIMLSKNPNLTIASERFMEITLGIVIATLISQFILPIHARTHLRRAQRATLVQIHDLYQIAIINPADAKIDYSKLDEDIVKSLIKQRQLAKESSKEPFGLAFNRSLFAETLFAEKEAVRAIIFMHKALFHLQADEYIATHNAVMTEFNAAILKIFDNLIDGMKSEKPVVPFVPLTYFDALKTDMVAYLKTKKDADVLNFYGYLFNAEILIASLSRLAQFYNVVSKD